MASYDSLLHNYMVAMLALEESYDYLSASEVTLQYMDNGTWPQYDNTERQKRP